MSGAGVSLNVYFTTCFFNDAVTMKGEDIEPVSNRKVNNQNTWRFQSDSKILAHEDSDAQILKLSCLIFHAFHVTLSSTKQTSMCCTHFIAVESTKTRIQTGEQVAVRQSRCGSLSVKGAVWPCYCN